MGARFTVKSPIFFFFKQYNKFFLKLKTIFKQLRKKKIKGLLEKFLILKFFKKVKNSRMGKGGGKFKGFCWVGTPGDTLIFLKNFCKNFFYIFLIKLTMYFKPILNLFFFKSPIIKNGNTA